MEHLPSPHSPVRSPSAAVYAVLLLTLVPGSAAAQEGPFIEACIRFPSMLVGTYGDEGAMVTASLDQTAGSFAAGEAATREAEARRTFELELRTREADPGTPEAGR